MRVFRMCFVGDATMHYPKARVKKTLKRILFDMCPKNQYVEFYVGYEGEYADLVATTIVDLRRDGKLRGCEMVLVLPYESEETKGYENFYYDKVVYPIHEDVDPDDALWQREEWLVDNSDFLITYIEEKAEDSALQKYIRKKGKLAWNIFEELQDEDEAEE